LELLVVIGVMAAMMALAIPAFNAIGNSANLTKSAYDLEGVLDEARTYAMANNTFVWVGVLEEDASKPTPSTPVTNSSSPGGRVILSVVASKDGTRYSDVQVDGAHPPAFGMESPSASPALNQVQLVQVNKIVQLNGIHLGTLNQAPASGPAAHPTRPSVAAAYQVGDPTFAQHSNGTGGTVTNPTTFTYPITRNQTIPPNLQYTFSKIIEFDPRGEASKIDENTFSGPGPQPAIEFGIQPTHGNAVDPRYTGASATYAAAAVQIEGISGKVRIFWP
jgi:hypothetical protein